MASPPPHPVPAHARELLHKALDELLDSYQWDQRPREQFVLWDYGTSSGRVRLVVESE